MRIKGRNASGHTSHLMWTLFFATMIHMCCSRKANWSQEEAYDIRNASFTSVSAWRAGEDPSNAPDRPTVALQRKQRHLQHKPSTSHVEYLAPGVQIKGFLEPVRPYLHCYSILSALRLPGLLGCTFVVDTRSSQS